MNSTLSRTRFSTCRPISKSTYLLRLVCRLWRWRRQQQAVLPGFQLQSRWNVRSSEGVTIVARLYIFLHLASSTLIGLMQILGRFNRVWNSWAWVIDMMESSEALYTFTFFSWVIVTSIFGLQVPFLWLFRDGCEMRNRNGTNFYFLVMKGKMLCVLSDRTKYSFSYCFFRKCLLTNAFFCSLLSRKWHALQKTSFLWEPPLYTVMCGYHPTLKMLLVILNQICTVFCR